MSGGGGGIVIINHVKRGLSDPIVHGSLPEAMVTLLDPVLAKESGEMGGTDKKILEVAISWALHNL